MTTLDDAELLKLAMQAVKNFKEDQGLSCANRKWPTIEGSIFEALKQIRDARLVLPNPVEFLQQEKLNYEEGRTPIKMYNWLTSQLRLEPAETKARVSDEELGISAYRSCKKVYQTDVLIADYTGGFRDGFRAAEKHHGIKGDE